MKIPCTPIPKLKIHQILQVRWDEREQEIPQRVMSHPIIIPE